MPDYLTVMALANVRSRADESTTPVQAQPRRRPMLSTLRAWVAARLQPGTEVPSALAVPTLRDYPYRGH
jgi:hypothetical protein